MNKGSSKKAQYMLTTIEVLVWQKDQLKLSLPSLYSTDVTLKYYTILQICLQHYQNIKGQFAWIINSYSAFLFLFVSAIRCISTVLDFLKVLYFVFPDWLCLRDCCFNSHVWLCVLFFNKQIIIIIIIIIQLKIIVIVIAKTIRYAYAYKNEFCPWELYMLTINCVISLFCWLEC